ncbi:helix-turn-helix transcriptional regulator [Candidatus Woesearchaeota archaeon]|nr:helix-turn-helix transcriptional regulator [Candidatus Woesearchaeota archaeon]
MTNVTQKVTMKTSEKTLLYLLKHPKKELHVRGLARELGIAPQIISRNLKHLEKQGMVSINRLGRQKFARLVYSQKFKSLAAYLLEREKEEMQSELQPIIRRLEGIPVKIAVLFGSSLKGLAKAADIDVLFIDNRLNAGEIDMLTTKLSAELPKPVVPLLLETKDIPKAYDNPAVQAALAGVVTKGHTFYIQMMEKLQ